MISTKDFKNKQIVFVLLEQGEKISFRNDNLVIKNKDGSTKFKSSCYLLFALFISGHLCLTDGVLQRAKKFGFSIIFMTYTFKVYAILPFLTEGNVLLRRKQYQNKNSEIAKLLIQNKIENQNYLLKKIRHKDEDLKLTIKKLEKYQNNLKVNNFELAQIMGEEGSAARLYFSRLFKDYHWQARRPRAKQDQINCLMDIGYNLLFNVIDGLLSMYGFDTYVGILHQEFYQRKSLVCDLVEPFRPIIDASILKMFNLKQVKKVDFSIIQGQYFLYGKAAAPYIQILIEAILAYKNEIFLYVQQYYRAFIQEKEISKYPYFRMEDKSVNC